MGPKGSQGLPEWLSQVHNYVNSNLGKPQWGGDLSCYENQNNCGLNKTRDGQSMAQKTGQQVSHKVRDNPDTITKRYDSAENWIVISILILAMLAALFALGWWIIVGRKRDR